MTYRRWLIGFVGLVISFPVLCATDNNTTFEYHLSNGLTLLVREDHRAPVVLSSIWYKVGGGYEQDGTTGISHVLEHMMFNGTHRFGPGELIKIISNNGGQQNAMTLADYTLYYQLLAANKLPLSFELEADRMRHLTLSSDAYTKELKIVMDERHMRIDDDPRQLTLERFYAAAYINNPYHHPVVGWMTDIKHLTLTDLKKWYHEWYTPNNAVVVVVGDVKAADVDQLAEKYFGKIKAEIVPQIKPQNEVVAVGERSLIVNIPAKLPWLVMGYNTPSLSTAKEKWQPYALMLVAYILGASDSSRFAHDLVRGQQIAIDASADYNLFQWHDNLLVLTGTPAPQHNVAELRIALENEIERLQNTLVTTAELDRAKAQIIAQNVYQKDSLMDQAFALGVPEMMGLSWRTEETLIPQIESITPQQIQMVARQFFIPQQLTMAVLTPTE